MKKLLFFYYANQFRFALIALFVITCVILVYVLPYFKEKRYVHFLMKPYLVFIIYILLFLILHILFNIETAYAATNDAILTFDWCHKSQIPNFNPPGCHKIANDLYCLKMTVIGTNGTHLLQYVVAPIDHVSDPNDLASYNIYGDSQQLKTLWLINESPEEVKRKAIVGAKNRIVSEREKAGYIIIR
uniref:hypothetical protein n=1 Tax=Pascua guehoae TaxID=105714 RepID=UPI00226D015F|nr:hypothetical protein OYX24_mgp04 [Pascua guehoae]UZC57694.1 hypothetical protein [Pascua guehoae]